MKTKLSFSLFFLIAHLSLLTAQVPQGFNYQAIARDGSGSILPNTPLQAMMYVQSLSTGGTIFWKELHSTITTNDFGLFTLVIGTGTRQIESTVATFDLIDWSVTPKYLKTQIYYDGSWKDMGVSQLMSVPYALRAKDSDQWQVNGADIYRQTGKVGIGTSTPLVPLSVYNPGSNTTIHIGGTAAGQTYLSAGTSASTNGYSYLQSIKTAGTAYGDLILNNSGGNVGIGITSPTRKLDVKGVIKAVTLTGAAATAGQFQSWTDGGDPGQRAVYSFYPTFEATPGGYTPRRAADILGGFNGGNWGTEFLSFNVGSNGSANDVENLTSEKMRITSSGNIGIGVTNPTSKVVVQPSASWDDNTPLFEVRNKSGIPVFAVYNNGVRILVDHTISKALKGGFAVGGYDLTKAGKTVDFMTISPDSIRFNINNDNVKALKGGFAVGGYDATKGVINQDFMYITPQTSNNGKYNTFLGYLSGHSMTTGKENVILGAEAGYFNNTGSQNVLIGKNAGYYNRSGGKNIILGWSDYVTYPGLDPGNSGSNNTLIGYSVGLRVTGSGNTALGYLAGHCLTLGTENTLLGSTAGLNITSGNYNVVIGTQAGVNITSGKENVFIGGAAGWSQTAGDNNIVLGTGADVPITTGSNQIRLGDNRITYAGIQVAWTITSDLRWKESVEDLSLGLNLVEGLRPVDYIRKNNISGTREAGFIAQDVQKLFSDMGIKNSGLLSVTSDGSLELRYNDFIPILTKAIQEQQNQIESTKQENLQLKSELQSLKDKMDKIEAMLAQGD